MRVMTAALFIFAVAACNVAQSPDLSKKSQYVRAENGNYEFFIGEAVDAQVARTGTYEPELRDWYSRLTFPESVVTQAIASGEPVSLSLCKADNGVQIYDHVYVGPDRINEYLPTAGPGGWVDPHYQGTAAGEFIQVYRSGDAGVYGIGQVRQAEDGSLTAGVAAEFYIEFGDEPGARSGGLLIGMPTNHDPHIEDSALTDGSCEAPSP